MTHIARPLFLLRSVQNTQKQYENHVEILNVKPDGTYSIREALKG